MVTLNAKELTLSEIHEIFHFQRTYSPSFTSLLSLEPLTEFEQQEIVQIRDDFDNYLIEGKVLEGMVKALTIFPLMRLAGFYQSPIKMTLEENIARIDIVDEDTNITGRIDILCVNKTKPKKTDIPFWILVIETKNSEADPTAGLSQLLTYTYKTLEYQPSVWGLSTNGTRYQFVYIEQGNPPTYQLMPFLNLMDSQPAIEILQVLKAICKIQNGTRG